MNWQTEYLPYGFCMVLAKPVSAASCSWHIQCSCPITKQYFYGYLPSSVQVPMIFPKSVFWMALLYNLFFGLFICVKIFIDIFAHIEIVHLLFIFCIFFTAASLHMDHKGCDTQRAKQAMWYQTLTHSPLAEGGSTFPQGWGVSAECKLGTTA